MKQRGDLTCQSDNSKDKLQMPKQDWGNRNKVKIHEWFTKRRHTLTNRNPGVKLGHFPPNTSKEQKSNNDFGFHFKWIYTDIHSEKIESTHGTPTNLFIQTSRRSAGKTPRTPKRTLRKIAKCQHMDFHAFLSSKMSTSTFISKNRFYLIGSPLCRCLHKLILNGHHFFVDGIWVGSTWQFLICFASPMLICPLFHQFHLSNFCSRPPWCYVLSIVLPLHISMWLYKCFVCFFFCLFHIHFDVFVHFCQSGILFPRAITQKMFCMRCVLSRISQNRITLNVSCDILCFVSFQCFSKAWSCMNILS